MSEPRFKVGDFLVSRGQLEAIRLFPNKYGSEKPVLFQVTEILSLACPGGTQFFYECRGCAPGGVQVQTGKFNEIELAPAPTVPAEPGGDGLADFAEALRGQT